MIPFCEGTECERGEAEEARSPIERTEELHRFIGGEKDRDKGFPGNLRGGGKEDQLGRSDIHGEPLLSRDRILKPLGGLCLHLKKVFAIVQPRKFVRGATGGKLLPVGPAKKDRIGNGGGELKTNG
jgi:hypothetical protein